MFNKKYRKRLWTIFETEIFKLFHIIFVRSSSRTSWSLFYETFICLLSQPLMEKNVIYKYWKIVTCEMAWGCNAKSAFYKPRLILLAQPHSYLNKLVWVDKISLRLQWVEFRLHLHTQNTINLSLEIILAFSIFQLKSQPRYKN